MEYPDFNLDASDVYADVEIVKNQLKILKSMPQDLDEPSQPTISKSLSMSTTNLMSSQVSSCTLLLNTKQFHDK